MAVNEAGHEVLLVDYEHVKAPASELGEKLTESRRSRPAARVGRSADHSSSALPASCAGTKTPSPKLQEER